jgi:lipoprotein-anchoring transpeptidase ErfK/SrfK
MRDTTKGLFYLGTCTLLLALLLAFGPFFVQSSYASPSIGRMPTTINEANVGAVPTTDSAANLSASSTGHTTGWSNVRTGPGTSYSIVDTYAPNTPVTIYATVSDQAVWAGISTWDRISSLSSPPLYIYGGLIAATTGVGTGSGGTPSPHGKEIIVSLSQQWMYAYQDGKQVYDSPITSGRPELPTPTGVYYIFAKLSPATFYSPWPPGSPYYYSPLHINYALEWRAGGFFLHDSWWRTVYGPGTNVWHQDPVYGRETGSHGCVNMPMKTAAWIYNWASIGTTVQLNP